MARAITETPVGNFMVLWLRWASQVVTVIKNPPANAGDVRDVGLITCWERCPGEHNNPLKYTCLENPLEGLEGYGPQGNKELDTTEATKHEHMAQMS